MSDSESYFPMRRFLCDWQIPDFLDEAVLDVDYFLDQAVKAGAQTIEFGLKNAFGNSLFPAEVGKQNKALKEDYFAEICEKAPERGLAVVAYYNMLLDDLMGKEHPEWLQRNSSGEGLKFESYHMFCMNSPYRDYVFSSLEEIARKYNVAGFMFDIQYWHRDGCFCSFCAERYENEAGRSFTPYSFSLKQWKLFEDARRRWRREFILTARKRLLRVNSGYHFTWNGSGNFSDDPELEQFVSHYGTEAHPPAYTSCSVKARWLNSSGKPFSMWMPESIGSWGHFTVTTAKTMKAMCAMTLANGGAVTANHIPMPTGGYAGKVFPGVYRMLSEVMHWVRENESFAGGEGIKCIGLLHSVENTSLYKTRTLARKEGVNVADRALGIPNSLAAGQILEELHVPYQFIHGEKGLLGTAPEELSEFEALLLPNIGFLREEAAKKIRQYVSEGGKLVTFYNTSLLDDLGEEKKNFLLSEVLGVDFLGYSDYSVTYVDRFSPAYQDFLPEIPILIKDTGYQTNPSHKSITCSLRKGAEALAFFTDPVLEADWEKGYHIYHDHAPPGRITQKPAIVRNRFDKGESIYFAFPLLQAFAFLPNPWHRNILRSSLKLLGIPEKVKIEAPVSLKSYVRKKGSRLLIHLVNLHREGDSMFLEENPSGGHVSFYLKGTPAAVKACYPADDEPILMSADAEGVRFTVEIAGIHRVIAIEGWSGV